jgi:hypothetical protein
MVLYGEGSCQYVGQMFHGVPREFFPMGKTNALRGKISNFQLNSKESIPEARERLQDYI